MTITVPTAELVHALEEIVPFASQDKNAFWHGILIEWDGVHLHFSGVDTLSGARITWIPGQGVEGTAEEGDDLPLFGGDDAPWQVFISVPSAKEIIKTYTLPAKQALVPLMVKVTPTGASLIVERSRETGQSQRLGMWPTDQDRAAKFPSVSEIAGPRDLDDVVAPSVVSFALPLFRLAAFGGAARHGVMTARFAPKPGPISMHNDSGTFVGFAYPAGTTAQAAAERNGSSFLRRGSGVHVSTSSGE